MAKRKQALQEGFGWLSDKWDDYFHPRPGQDMTRETGLMERVTDPARVNQMELTGRPGPRLAEAPEMSVEDLEGRNFISYMMDTSDGSLDEIESLNGVDVHTVRQGGDNFQRQPQNVADGRLWGSAQGAVQGMVNRAANLGDDTLFIPYRMGPKSTDFATMTSDLMNDYAAGNMSKPALKELNAGLKTLLPDFPGIGQPGAKESLHRMKGPQRAKFRNFIDKNYRDQGALSLSEARAAVVDPRQVDAPMGGLGNVGVVDVSTGKPMSGNHNTYDSGLPGEFLGRLKEDVRVTDLAQDWREGRQAGNPTFDPYNLSAPDQKSLQAGVGGTITSDIIEYILSQQKLRAGR